MLASGSMLIPKGQTVSLMDAERIDLYSVTGMHGIRLPGTHTHTQMYRYLHTASKNSCKAFIYSAHILFIHASSLTHLSREITKGKHSVLSEYVLSGIEHTHKESVKLSNTSWLLAGLI